MISLNTIINTLEDRLNDSIGTELDLFPRRRFLFNVFLDTGDYKKPIFEQNLETYYINALATVASTSGEGLTVDSYNASVSLSLEFLIPFAGHQNEHGDAVFVERVRDLITNTLQIAQSMTMTDGDESDPNATRYFVGLNYRIANTGRREIRDLAGDSMTLLVYIDLFLASEGISSDEIILELGDGFGEEASYTRIYPSQHGMKRNSTGEDFANIGGIGGMNVSASALAVTFQMPLRRNAAGFAALEWLGTGRKRVLALRITYPNAYGTTSVSIPVVYESVAISCALNYNANLVCEIKQEIEASDEGDEE